MKPTLNTGIQALIEGFTIAKTPEVRPSTNDKFHFIWWFDLLGLW